MGGTIINKIVSQIFLESLCEKVNETYPDVQAVAMEPQELVFEERVKMNCFYCGKYGANWRCPPRLPDIDYQKMVREYTNGAFVYLTRAFDDLNYQEVRNESSVILHKALLEFEKLLWKNDYSMAVSFIGGSCKLCKNGCGKEKCNNPYNSRSPLEAIGVHVLKSAEKYGIHIKFPPDHALTRIGLLLW